MELIRWAGVVAGMLLQLAIIAKLLKGGHRAYPILLALMVCDFLWSVASAAAVIDVGKWTHQTRKIYWLGDGIQYMLLFAFQVHTLHRGLGETKSRRRVGYLVCGGLLFAGLAAWMAYNPRFNLWMTELVRNFSFGCMLLNLALWTTLMRNPDRGRLMVTAAVGTLLAGTAIGHSLRQISPQLVSTGNLVLLSSYLFYLGLLWRTATQFALVNTPVSEGPSATLRPAESLHH